jgi:hypothetical protein
MGETEKTASEAAVVPPPQPPAALPLGPQPGVKYPIQESHFVISSKPMLYLRYITEVSFFSFAHLNTGCLRSWYMNVWVGSVLRIRIRMDPHHFRKLDPDPLQSEKVESLEGNFGALEDPNLG